MKKITTSVVGLFFMLNIAGSVPPGVSAEEEKQVADIDQIFKSIDQIEARHSEEGLERKLEKQDRAFLEARYKKARKNLIEARRLSGKCAGRLVYIAQNPDILKSYDGLFVAQETLISKSEADEAKKKLPAIIKAMNLATQNLAPENLKIPVVEATQSFRLGKFQWEKTGAQQAGLSAEAKRVLGVINEKLESYLKTLIPEI